MSIPLVPIAIVGYIVGTLLASLGLVYRSPAARRAASAVFVATWLVHLAAIVRQGLEGRQFPISNAAEFLLVVGWVVLTLHLWVWFRLHVHVAGLVLPPIGGVATAAAMPLLSTSDAPVARPSAWFIFHTTVSTLGTAILCVAFAMAVFYLIQDRALKSGKTLRLLERLPALEKCDSVGFRALLIGFLLLTVGIGTGVMINADVYQRLWVLGPKQLFPLLAWLVFAAVLTARTVLGFRGKKSAYLTITGFALVVFTVLGMNL